MLLRAFAISKLDLQVRDHDGASLGATERLLTWFPAAFDYYSGVPARVVLTGGSFGLVWLECDGSPCSLGIASQSCTGRYQRFDDAGQPSGAAVTLFEGRWGDMELAYNATQGQILVLHAPPQAGSFGSARVTSTPAPVADTSHTYRELFDTHVF